MRTLAATNGTFDHYFGPEPKTCKNGRNSSPNSAPFPDVGVAKPGPKNRRFRSRTWFRTWTKTKAAAVRTIQVFGLIYGPEPGLEPELDPERDPELDKN